MSVCVLVKWKYGYLSVEPDPQPPGKLKTYYLDLGRMSERTAVLAAAEATLTSLSIPSESITVGVVPETDSEWPGDDTGIQLGDAVDTLGIDGTLSTYRMVGVNTTIDRNGFAVPAPTFNSQAEEHTARLARWLEALTQGTIGGRTTASPTSDPLAVIPTGQISEPNVPVFDFNGPLAVSESSLWEVDQWCALTSVTANLRTASSSGAVGFEIYVNGSSGYGGSIPVGDTRLYGTVYVNLVPGDYLGVLLTGTGTGAESLTIQYSAAPTFLQDSATG